MVVAKGYFGGESKAGGLCIIQGTEEIWLPRSWIKYFKKTPAGQLTEIEIHISEWAASKKSELKTE